MLITIINNSQRELRTADMCTLTNGLNNIFQVLNTANSSNTYQIHIVMPLSPWPASLFCSSNSVTISRQSGPCNYLGSKIQPKMVVYWCNQHREQLDKATNDTGKNPLRHSHHQLQMLLGTDTQSHVWKTCTGAIRTAMSVATWGLYPTYPTYKMLTTNHCHVNGFSSGSLEVGMSLFPISAANTSSKTWHSSAHMTNISLKYWNQTRAASQIVNKNHHISDWVHPLWHSICQTNISRKHVWPHLQNLMPRHCHSLTDPARWLYIILWPVPVPFHNQHTFARRPIHTSSHTSVRRLYTSLVPAPCHNQCVCNVSSHSNYTCPCHTSHATNHQHQTLSTALTGGII